MLRSLTLSAIDELDAGAVPAASTTDTLVPRLEQTWVIASPNIRCIFAGGELGSTGVIKTVPRPKAKKVNANDNFAPRMALAA